MPNLKVIAVPGRIVLDDLAAQANARRFVGRAQAANPKADPDDLEAQFPPEPREYADNAQNRYLIRSIQKGDLAPSDEYTAKRAGVELPRPATTAHATKTRKDS